MADFTATVFFPGDIFISGKENSSSKDSHEKTRK